MRNMLFTYQWACYCLRAVSLVSLFLSWGILPVNAEVKLQSGRLSLEYRSGVNLQNGDLDLSRVTLSSAHKFRFSSQWSGQIDTLSQLASDNTGLGRVDNFASLNRPIFDNNKARVELARASVMWRKRGTSVVIGKQVTPWGVLDGIQVTDRFDPVRRRDFVLTDMRPERIARWGVRWRTKVDGWHIDTSLALDGSTSQQARMGDAFFLTSTRFTAGLTLDDVNVSNQAGEQVIKNNFEIVTPERSHALAHSTAGLKVAHSLGDGDVSLMVFRGPDADPVLGLHSMLKVNQPIRVSFDYLRRTVFGATYDVTQGATVWRLELAYIPDQPLNILASVPLAQARGQRILTGVGMDWRAPNDWFINTQLVVDYIEKDNLSLVRPQTDTLLTLRAQRSFYNARLVFKSELLASVNQGDGAIRPAFAFDWSDRIKLQSGIDWLFGDPNGQFGQFKDASRWWASFTYTF
ncbi:hypothetical protein [Paraglaciecola polaris]|uniref:Alginate export domain-containing protein n=1 Tax=Paraglaciecola polaris LMG 21857 TaxID=1129793 RepID=K7AB11_9ALTE|nr:hypothetical protein [Paraglaciecola polaris]GAC32570.1 hypothetical protein GPLA_1656 [Paraglaciecola polaris LMG 21857]|tara:strand:- start:13733 stop:15121 length:1389 start_codon:yes stop_codon:yes gene_type:complete